MILRVVKRTEGSENKGKLMAKGMNECDFVLRVSVEKIILILKLKSLCEK